MQIKGKTRSLAIFSMLVAVAMILSYVESLVPPLVAVPGVKIGLSNIVTVFALYTLGIKSAFCVSLVKVSLSALLFGNVASFIFSLSGAMLSLFVMVILTRVGPFSHIGVSALGGVFHNVGQIIAAVFVLKNTGIIYYLAPLVISGTLAGVGVGVVAGILVGRLERKLGKNQS